METFMRYSLWIFAFACALGGAAIRAADTSARLTNAECAVYSEAYKNARDRGDFATAEKEATTLYRRCLDTFGPQHPDTKSAASIVAWSREIQLKGIEVQDRYQKTCTTVMLGMRELKPQHDEIFLEAEGLRRCLDRFERGVNDATDIPSASLIRAGCLHVIANVARLSRAMEAAERFASQADALYASDDGGYLEKIYLQVTLARLLRELHKDPERQISLLENIIAFRDRYPRTERLMWQRERALTELAETHFWLGNRAEADRLYALVRKDLPGDSVYTLVGLCKSRCDWHEARQLMEQGDYERAYEKILSARLGTIKYGRQNLNKGLTMERILRLSAENRRKLGRDKEADEDLAYAQRIADHAARLKAAMEPEFERLEIKIGPTTKTAAPADRNLVPGR